MRTKARTSSSQKYLISTIPHSGTFIIPSFRKYYCLPERHHNKRQCCDMKKYQLGEFEEIVILTIGLLYNEAYGVGIKNEIEKRLSRTVSMGALHAALVRLEDKGYIKSFRGESMEERAGRPRHYYQIRALGKKAMSWTRETREQLWRAIPRVVLEIN